MGLSRRRITDLVRSSRRRLRPIVLAALLLATSPSPAVLPTGLYALGPKLVAGDAVGGALQGGAVALSADGNTAIFGGSWDDSLHGAAWVYVREEGFWHEQMKLIGSNSSAQARQGIAVAISADGSTALVGGFQDGNGTGAAWVFTRSGSTWSQQGPKLVGTGGSGTAGTSQGIAVALSADGSTALVGGSADGNATGAAWVFTRSAGVWTQQGGKLVGTGSVGTSGQGNAVALSGDGNTAIVGGQGDNANAGAAWIFTRSGGVWTQQGGKLLGNDAVGNASQAASVALSSDGSTAIWGGPADNGFHGAAWVFTRSGNTWTQQGPKLVGIPGSSTGQQGYSVGLSGNGSTAILGAPQEIGFGAAWTFTRSGVTWSQRGGKYVGTAAVGSFALQGNAVALSGDGSTALVGGFYDDIDNNTGAVWVLDRLPVKGDVNGNGVIDVADVFFLINYLFAAGPSPR
jgi:hypothetical protein